MARSGRLCTLRSWFCAGRTTTGAGEVENDIADKTGGDVADDALSDLFMNCSDHFTHVHVHKHCQSVVFSVKLGFQEDFGADARGHELAAVVPELNGDVARDEDAQLTYGNSDP